MDEKSPRLPSHKDGNSGLDMFRSNHPESYPDIKSSVCHVLRLSSTHPGVIRSGIGYLEYYLVGRICKCAAASLRHLSVGSQPRTYIALCTVPGVSGFGGIPLTSDVTVPEP